MELVLLLLIVGGALIAAAVVVSRWLWRKGRLGRLVLGLLGISIGWQLHGAIYPPESFYVSEFERLTGLSLPVDARFVEKTATFPDHFGDYSACFTVQLSPEAISALAVQLGEPKESKNRTVGCAQSSWSGQPMLEAALYDLAPRATRKDAQIYVLVAPEKNLVEVSWYLW